MAKNKTPKQKRRNNYNVTWAQAFRDIIIASMNKGQLPFVSIFFIFCLSILKMPSEDVSTLVFGILSSLKKRYIYGYFFSIIILLIFFLHSRYVRRHHSHEMDRIAGEKSKLQEQLSGIEFKSSEER